MTATRSSPGNFGVTPKRTWNDVEELGRDLAAGHPGVDPLALDLPSIKALVTALPTFGDEPDASGAATLEAIQAAWYDALQN
jgi:FeS assembly protein IscX